jgi:hypothetical protein
MALSEQDQLDARTQRADAREAELDRREAALERRVAVAQTILDAAEARDVLADGRDGDAVERDRDEDLRAFVDPAGSDTYGWDTPGRRHAALDRGHAKDDRSWAAGDRTALTADLEPDPAVPTTPLADRPAAAREGERRPAADR